MGGGRGRDGRSSESVAGMRMRGCLGANPWHNVRGRPGNCSPSTTSRMVDIERDANGRRGSGIATPLSSQYDIIGIKNV